MRIKAELAPSFVREGHSRRLIRSYRIRTSEHRRAREWKHLRQVAIVTRSASDRQGVRFDVGAGRAGERFTLTTSLRRHWVGTTGAVGLLVMLCLYAAGRI